MINEKVLLDLADEIETSKEASSAVYAADIRQAVKDATIIPKPGHMMPARMLGVFPTTTAERNECGRCGAPVGGYVVGPPECGSLDARFTIRVCDRCYWLFVRHCAIFFGIDVPDGFGR